MIKKLLCLLVLLLTATTGAWAQTTINVTAGDLGKAVCTDGSIYDDVNAAKSAGKTAAAKIICLDTQNSKALALSLDDQAVEPSPVNYATAQSKCEALNTTLAVTFGTWVLPSKAQWEAMIVAAGGYNALRDDIGPFFGGTMMQAVTYWSSTAGTTGHWRINFYDGKWDDNTGESSARACLVINLPQTYSVTLADGTEDATNWTIASGQNSVKGNEADGLTGLSEGATVTATYSGDKKVKSVKAVKKNTAKTLAEATSEDIGKIAGKDGNIYATKADAEAVATGNAVAMIAYVGTASDCAHGLAIALEDVSNEQLTWDNSGINNNSKTAAEWCSAWNTSKAVTGGTWRLPSISDWQYMFIGCGASGSYSDSPISMSCSELASKLTTAQGAALQTDHYWSSTESSPGSLAWKVVFDVSSTNFIPDDEYSGHRVRACLAF